MRFPSGRTDHRLGAASVEASEHAITQGMRRIGESDIGNRRSYNPKPSEFTRDDGYGDESHGLPGPSKPKETGGFGKTSKARVDISAVTAHCCSRAGGLPRLGEPSGARMREDFNGA